MKKRLILILAFVLLALCACGNNTEEIDKNLQGAWGYYWYADAVDMDCYSFYQFENGSVKHTLVRGDNDPIVDNGTYTIKNKKIIISYSDSTEEMDYTFDSDVLSISINDWVYERIEE